MPGFGDPAARVLLFGLAPAAHGANRTGRVFTGDRSGDFLFAALHRAGFANQPTSFHRGDGLTLRDCYITAAVRCAPPANKPTPDERDACQELVADRASIAPPGPHDSCASGRSPGTRAVRALRTSIRRSAVRHSVTASEATVGKYTLLGCYHPSQQNTFTGRLTAAMLDEVLERAKKLLPVS